MIPSKTRSVKIYETQEGKRPFESWFKKLKDMVGKARIVARIERAGAGNFGNYRELGEGVFELKEPYGPGYRIYFSVEKSDWILLLVGGDKGSQKSDIEKAKKYWQDYQGR